MKEENMHREIINSFRRDIYKKKSKRKAQGSACLDDIFMV